MTERTCQDYLSDIIIEIENIADFIWGMDYAGFQEDTKTQHAVCKAIENIGEAAKHIPKHLQRKFNSIPWKEMTGLRNIVTHEYHGIDYWIVWETATKDIPPLEESIRNMKFVLEVEGETEEAVD
jgi:uncharacterized protein with HEPN domain